MIFRGSRLLARCQGLTLMVWAVLVMIVGISALAGAQGETGDLKVFLEKNIGLSMGELGAIDKEVVVKQLDPEGTKREMAIFGIVRIAVPRDFFLAEFRDIKNFMHNKKVEQIGSFSTPPGQSDIATLQLPESDIKELEKCKKGSCKVKLPDWGFDRLEEINWSQGDPTDSVRKLFRKGVFEYVEGYLENGNEVLMVYADKEEPMSLRDGLNSLLRQASYVYRSNPVLYSCLKDSPPSAPPGMDDFLSWSVEDFGQRPTTAVTQAVIYEGTGENQDVIIALKQLYATHYFQARLQFIHLAYASPTLKDPGIYLMYVDRLLFDADLGTVTRLLISKGLHSHVQYWLAEVRDRLEDEYKKTKGKEKVK